VIVMAATGVAHGAEATPDEMFAARRWVAAKFEGAGTVASPASGLVVVTNYDLVWQNCRVDRPLMLGHAAFRRGLFTHAPSKIVVRLPEPGAAFSATAGVDTNQQTSGGRGSVVFSVSVRGKEVFRSPIMREGMPGAAVSVNLRGAREFAIEVGDAGDGIACDQADWVDAKVTLKDGSVVWLGDLPIIEGQAPAPLDIEPPFSFTYGGRDSTEFLKTWRLDRASRQLDEQRTEHTLTYSDPETGLAVRCVSVEYHDFPTVEWTLYFRNDGTADTPIISDIQALDATWQRHPDDLYARYARQGEFALHHGTGSICAQTDYQPLQTPLGAGADRRVTTSGGRSSNSDLPYFNVEWPGEGVIAVIGWPGQWAAQFTRDGNSLRVRAGQELTHFTLHPGEEVRTPLMVVQFWKGDRVRSQNVWRQWMLAHNVPRPGGQLHGWHMSGCSSHFFGEMVTADTASQIEFIDRYLAERIKIDYWWMDAGWYIIKTNWPDTGTWEVDQKRFPGGLRPICDYAHAKDLKTIVWFEPERVAPGTWLAENHPEWIFGGAGGGLLNLGDPAARQWLTDHVDRLITEQGIDLYRNDFNIDPLSFWRGNDAENRQGITEIRYVEGFLAYWDELRRRHPDMLIDTCASGGRRNDLETLRRSVPLWRSDYILEPVGTQCHTYGISFWIPLNGTGAKEADRYLFRSNMCPYVNCLWDARRTDLDYDLLRTLTEQWRAIAPCYLGDYYPLTAYSTGDDVWMGWQFDRPDLGEGFVQVFRRADSIYQAAQLPLQGLDPDARYRITDLDQPRAATMTGRELMDAGVPVAINDRPGSALITYQRVKAKER
jgi:alpha-galactosidase